MLRLIELLLPARHLPRGHRRLLLSLGNRVSPLLLLLLLVLLSILARLAQCQVGIKDVRPQIILGSLAMRTLDWV